MDYPSQRLLQLLESLPPVLTNLYRHRLPEVDNVYNMDLEREHLHQGEIPLFSNLSSSFEGFVQLQSVLGVRANFEFQDEKDQWNP